MQYSVQLRSLLRAARVNAQLERHSFGVRLQQAMGAPSVREALVAAGERAFRDLGDPYALHREVLLEYTIRQNLSREHAAKRCGISVRRFFYVYAESVAILEREVQGLLQADQRTEAERLLERLFDSDPHRAYAISATLPANQREPFIMRELHARIVSSSIEEPPPGVPENLHGAARGVAEALCAWALELRGRREEALCALERAESLKYDHLGRTDARAHAALLNARTVVARHDGDARALMSLAANDRADATVTIEAALATGDPIRARGALERARSAASSAAGTRSIASIALHCARIELVSGNCEQAQRQAALLMQLAQPHGDIRDMARVVCARAAAMQRGRIDEAPTGWHGDWHLLYYTAALARRRHDDKEAERVFGLALARGYFGIAAHACATIAWLRDDMPAASDAWGLWMRGRHFEQGFDMMPPQVGTAPLHGAAMRSHIRMVAAAECADWPVHALLGENSAADRFWQTVLHAATGAASMRSVEPMAAALIARAGSVTMATSAGASPASARRLAKCISVALPLEKRAEFIRRFTAAIAACNARALRSFRQTRARIVLKAAM